MIALPDINVLLALAWSNHAHHDAAHRWFARDATAGWATCLLTQTGFLRLSLNPQVVGVSIDCQAAVHLLRSPVAHPYHQYTDIAPALTTTSFDELVPKIVGYRQVSDAMLLHLARGGWTEAGHIRPTGCGRVSMARPFGTPHTVKRRKFNSGKAFQRYRCRKRLTARTRSVSRWIQRCDVQL